MACSLTENREKNFRTALTSWLQVVTLTEIVVVDWLSTVNVTAIVTEIVEGVDTPPLVTLVSVSVGRNIKWRLTAAVNLGVEHIQSTASEILKVDADTWVHPDILTLNGLEDGCVVKKGGGSGENSHLNGVFLVRRKHFNSVRGFDERLDLYGWDDSDLYERILRSAKDMDPLHLVRSWRRSSPICNFKQEYLSQPMLAHLPHERGSNTFSELVMTCFNRAATLILSPVDWTEDSTGRYHTEVKSYRGEIMFISVRALSHTKSLQYRLAEMALCEPVLFECIHGKLFGTDYVFYVNGSPIYDTDLNIASLLRARSSAKNREKVQSLCGR